MCGGKGSRLLPISLIKQKSVIELAGKPILDYVIEYWSQFTNDFIFVVKYKKGALVEHVKKLPIKADFAEPENLKGIADGISTVESMVGERFIVVLGDCVCRGIFRFPVNFEQGVAVLKGTEPDEIKRNFSVEVEKDSIIRVVEKPAIIPNNLCGIGFYFFSKKVFDYIRQAGPSKFRGEVEITDVIQNMIDAHEKISPVFFSGDYLNITYEEDLIKAENLFGNAV